MDKETITQIVLPSLLGLFVVAGFWWFDRRSKIILQNWAEENGFQITQSRQRYKFFTGPFKWWTNSRNQVIFFVKVRDRDGRERSGWIRCGNYSRGVFFSNEVEAKWD
jgi:hypothetical protein